MPYWDDPEFTAVYPEDDARLKSHIVRIGMTKEEVLDNLGTKPRRITEKANDREIWVYGKFWRGDIQVALIFAGDRIEKIEEFYLATSNYQDN